VGATGRVEAAAVTGWKVKAEVSPAAER